MEVVARLAAGIWNGPFYIGKLTRPVTLGEVALKVLETFWRMAVISVALVLAIFGYILFEDVRPEPKSLAEQVEATAAWGDGCDGEMPIAVTIKNASKKKVGRVDFELSAFEPGRTTDLVSILSRDYISDVVIPAGQTASLCFVAPGFRDAGVGTDATRLRYVVEIKTVETTNLQ